MSAATHARRLAGAASFITAGVAWFAGASAAEPAGMSDQQVWHEECGGCHIAYPARFLPQASWDEIMRSLNEHFGADASLDEATAAGIRRYLASAARPHSRPQPNPPDQRITKTRWFMHEHDEISPARWRSPQVRSAANCGACHQDADAGRFNEGMLKVPK
jgi:Dihaem cytochrome c